MILVPLVLLVGCVLRGGGTFTPFATLSTERPLAESVERLVVTTNVGDVVISPSPGAELKIEAVVSVRADRVNVEKAGKQFEDHVRVSERNGVLTIEDGHRDGPDREDWSVTLRVTAPRALAVSAVTGVGNVDVQTATGEVDVRTGVGDARLSAREIAGASVKSGTGNVQVDVGRVGGDLEASCGVGNVIAKASGVAGRTRASAGTGDVDVAFIGTQPGGDVSARSGVGDVRVMLPANAAGNFSAQTGVGELSVGGLTGVIVSRKVVGASASGTVGEGGPQYSISTGTGRVTVRAGD